LDLALVVLPSRAEAQASYLARWTEHWSGFAEGWAALQRGQDAWTHDVGAAIGIRGTW
jgi:hypothetical protein